MTLYEIVPSSALRPSSFHVALDGLVVKADRRLDTVEH
jgi:hypothetical protein